MKKLLLTLTVLIVSIGAFALEKTVTYTFTSNSWEATCDQADFGSNWVSVQNATAQQKQGIQITKSDNGACANSPVSFNNIKKVVLTYGTSSKGVGSVNISLVDKTDATKGIAKATKTVSKSQTNATLEWIPASQENGYVQFFVTCTTSSIYINKIAITYEEEPAHEPYTVKLNAGSGQCTAASLTEPAAGAGVVLPEAIGISGWEFAGWADASVTATTTRPTLYAAGSAYVPTEDNVTLYAVYSHAEAGAAPAEEKEVATYSVGSSDWTTGGSTTNKSDYYLLANKTGYLETNEAIDFNTITKVIVKVRTFGGTSYNSFNIETEDGAVWGAGSTSKGTTATEITVTKNEGSTATGVSKLKVISTCGTNDNQGIGVYSISVYAKDAFVTTYDSNPSEGGEVVKREFTFDGFKDYTLKAGETVTLDYPSNSPEVVLVSDDDTIALAEDKVIKGVKAGTTTITAMWDESEYWLEGSAEFTVKVVNVAELILNEEALAMNLGDAPAAMPYAYDGDGAVSVATSDAHVATAVLAEDGETISVTAIGAGEATITVSATSTENYTAAEAKFIVTVTDPNAPVYTLVTNVNQLQDGDKVIIACPEKNMIMSTESETNFRHVVANASSFNKDKTVIEYGSGMMILELGKKDNDTYTFKTTNYAGNNGYLGNNTKSNYCYVYTTNQDGSNATITINESGLATIVFDNSNGSSEATDLRYNPNNGNPRFSCYKSTSNMSLVSIYRFGVPVEKELIAFEFDGFKNYTFNLSDESFKLTLPEDAPEITYTSTNDDVVTYIDDNEFMFGEAGTATITATWSENDKYLAGNATFTVTVTDGETPVVEATTSTYNFNYLEESMMDEAQSDLGEYWSTLYTKSYRGNGHVQVMISTANKLEYVQGEGWKFVADADDEVNAYIYVLLNDKLDGSQYDVTSVNFDIDANPEFYEISYGENVTVSNNVWTGKTSAPVFKLYSLGDIVIGDIDVTFEHDVIAAPVFSMRALTVTLSHEAGHTIMYKVTSSRAQAPAREAATDGFTEYTEPFKVNKGDVVEYYAVHPHGMTSTTVTRDIITTGIDGIDADDDSEVIYYNLQGVRVASENLVPGIYVRAQGGTTTKVLVK